MKTPFIRFRIFNCLLGSLLFCAVATVQASTILYSVAPLGGTTWEYSYDVANDSLGSDIEAFSIFFDVDLFTNLQSAQAPGTWDAIAIQSDPAVPDDGFYDALSIVTGIAPNEMLAGFTVQFDYLGIGTPGAQAFAINDPLTFSALDRGMTTVVPLPAAVWLLATGIFSLFFMSRRSKIKTSLANAAPA